MKLTALQYGKTRLPARMAFADADPMLQLPISLLFFLLETDDGRRSLIDVGCDTMPGFELLSHVSPPLVLERTGVRREEITDIYLTHAHHDHIDAVRHYPQATVHIHRAELAAARPYLDGAASVEPFDTCIEIASGVQMRHVGGHSPGSSIVLLQAREETVVLCGDECYTRENLTRGVPTASSFCPERSLAFIQEYGKPCYRTVLFHDAALVGDVGARVLIDGMES